MKTIVFDIKTKQPVLATSFQGDPNSDVSYGYIPGSTIRGALIGRYLKQHPELRNVDILNDASIRSLFFENTTRYLNAYLYDEQHSRRTLPSPVSWHQDKQSSFSDTDISSCGMEVYDLSQGVQSKSSLSKVSEPFCSVTDKDIWLFREARRVNIHHQRDRRKGRAMKGQGRGEIFCYDALEADQIFRAAIVCDLDKTVDKIRNLLEQENLWLGGSQTAGYGHCQILHIEVKENWTEIGEPVEGRRDRDLLTVHLLSDLMLRDINGQHVVSPPTKLLEEALGVELHLQKSFLTSQFVGGFNRKWGLPLPQVEVATAGSVFIYKPEGQLRIEILRELEEKGIGDRRIDGFGRIAFNWLEEECETFRALQPMKRRNNLPPTLKGTSRSLASAMATRLLRQRLDGYLLREVGRYSIDNPPTNNQLSRIMLTAQKALLQMQQRSSYQGKEKSEDEFIEIASQAFTQLFDNLPRNATQQLEKAKVSVPFKPHPVSIAQVIKAWLENPDEWLTHPPRAEISETTLEVTPLLKQEYTLHLIMAIAKKAIKENPDD